MSSLVEQSTLFEFLNKCCHYENIIPLSKAHLCLSFNSNTAVAILGIVKSASTKPHVATSRRIPDTKQNAAEEGSADQPNTIPKDKFRLSKEKIKRKGPESADQPNIIPKDKCRLSKADIKRKGPEADQHIDKRQKRVAKNAPEPDQYGLI